MLIPQVVSETRYLSVLDRLNTLSKNVTDNYCEIAELLHETWENNYFIHKGYETFQDFAEKSLDIKGRKAYFLVQITKTLKKLNIPWSDVREVGWRKMASIAPILNSDNHEELILDAKNLTLPALSEKVKAKKQGKEETDSPLVRMTVQMSEDENTIVQAAIEYAKKHEGVKSNSNAIVHICYEYAQKAE